MQVDRDTWTSETRTCDDDAPRLAMIDAVLGRLERGMSRNAVSDLLGAPTETPYFRDPDLVYWLGQGWRGLSVDSFCLLGGAAGARYRAGECRTLPHRA